MYLPVVRSGEPHDLGGAGSESEATWTALGRGSGGRSGGEGEGNRVPGGDSPALAGGQPRHLGAPHQPPVLPTAISCRRRGRRRGFRFLSRGSGLGGGFGWWGRFSEDFGGFDRQLGGGRRRRRRRRRPMVEVEEDVDGLGWVVACHVERADDIHLRRALAEHRAHHGHLFVPLPLLPHLCRRGSASYSGPRNFPPNSRPLRTAANGFRGKN
jgi:hypothetical protein